MIFRKRKGQSIVEMVAYIAIAGLVGTVVYSTLYRSSDAVIFNTKSLVDEQRMQWAASFIRKDVMNAKALMNEFADYRQAPDTLILRVPTQGEANGRVTIYTKQDGKLQRLIGLEGESARAIASGVALPVDSLQFEVNGDLVSTSIVWKERRLRRTWSRRKVEFLANLRNAGAVRRKQ